jgi:hypothetical protein
VGSTQGLQPHYSVKRFLLWTAAFSQCLKARFSDKAISDSSESNLSR